MEKTEEQLKKEAMDNIKEVATKSATEKVAELKEEFAKFATKEEAEKANKELSEKVSNLSAEIKKQKQFSQEDKKEMTIHEAISKSLVENQEKLSTFKDDSMKIALKAIDSTAWAGNALANVTTERRQNLYATPYSPLYLRNIFPNVSTTSSSIIIPQIQEITGGVDVWARGTGTEGADVEKPELGIKYKDVTVSIDWLAGFTTVNRELLLNVGYLQSSITNSLLYSRQGLFARENKYITDYLSANAVAYSGDKTIGVEKLIDAAFNQLLGNYLMPTHILMNQADYLEYIKFNKAATSDVYDLPNETLRGFTGSGLETNVQIVPVPTLTAGTAYVVSANEFEFINRLSPELEVSRQHDKNLTFNKVTFLLEEMVGFVAKDLNAMVKVTLGE